MGSETRANSQRCLEVFGRADLEWAQHTSSGLPLLLLPSERFGWKESHIYFANVALREPLRAPLLVLELCAFDAHERQRSPEVDWCIPIGGQRTTEREQLRAALGLGEGWSDSFEVLTRAFLPEWRTWYREVVERRVLVLGERGQATASILQHLDRNLETLARFTDA